MRLVASSLAAVSALGLAACAVQPPAGPSFAAMPGPGKTFDQFQADNARCQVAAQRSIPTSPAQAANQSAVGSAVLGTAIGAAAGAALGAAGGAAGVGAAIGAGTGLLAGSAIGAGNAQASGAAMQQRYDITYAQCMTAAGETVPQPTAAAGYPGGGYPAGGYAAYPAYGYGYPYPYPYYADYWPPVAFGFGWGGGWHGH